VEKTGKSGVIGGGGRKLLTEKHIALRRRTLARRRLGIGVGGSAGSTCRRE